MDKTEQLADMVILAAQAFIEKKLAPVLEAVASMKREMDARGFLTKDDAVIMFAGVDAVTRLDNLLQTHEQLTLFSRGATLDMVRAEAGAAALDACTKLLEAIPKPADGKSVTMAEVMPEIERLVADIPRPKDGSDADPDDMRAEVARQIALVPPPQDGKSVDLGAIFTEIGGAVQRAVAELPKPEDGKSVTLDEVRPLIAEGVADAVAQIPKPVDGVNGKDGTDGVNGKDAEVDWEALCGVARSAASTCVKNAFEKMPKPKDGEDGKSVTVEEVRPLLAEMVAGIRVPEDGKSVTVDDVLPLIDKGIADAVAGIRVPEDGKSVTVDDVRPMLAEMVATIPPPKDGKDADLAVLNDLVVISVKAAMAEFRPPEKGEPGKDADPVDMDELRRYLSGEVSRELATWERPEDGKDGLGFDDMTMDLEEDGRTMVFRFSRDGREKRFEIVCPWQIYRDVYKAGQSYQRGDQVTYGGSQFTAKRDTDKVPGTDDWVLSVKRGKDAH